MNNNMIKITFKAAFIGDNGNKWEDEVRVLDSVMVRGNTQYLVRVTSTQSDLPARVGKVLLIDPENIVSC